jgi:hypothetical protein
VSTEAVGDVSKDPSPILDLHPEHPIGKDLDNPTCIEIGRLGHEPSLYLKLARFNRGRHGTATHRLHQPASLTLRSLAPLDRVRIRGPSSVIATVCSK